MELTEKVSYIKGLMDGMQYDTATNEGKILAAMLDLLKDIADEVSDHDDVITELCDDVDAINEDLDDLEELLFDEDDEDEDEDEDDGEDAEYELTCPNCGTVLTVDESTLLNEHIFCPSCHTSLDIEFDEDDEKEEEGGEDPQD